MQLYCFFILAICLIAHQFKKVGKTLLHFLCAHKMVVAVGASELLLYRSFLLFDKTFRGRVELWILQPSVDKQAIDRKPETPLNSDYSHFVTPEGMRMMSFNQS